MSASTDRSSSSIVLRKSIASTRSTLDVDAIMFCAPNRQLKLGIHEILTSNLKEISPVISRIAKRPNTPNRYRPQYSPLHSCSTSHCNIEPIWSRGSESECGASGCTYRPTDSDKLESHCDNPANHVRFVDKLGCHVSAESARDRQFDTIGLLAV